MQYVVRALDPGQQIQTLVLDALDEADAHAQARAQRLSPLSVTRRRGAAWQRDEKFPLLMFAQELHALLHAGLSVIESLEALIEKDTQASRRAVLARLAEQLRQGQRLSSALRNQPQIFPPLFVGVIQAAEGTSDLPQALARFLEYETRVQSVRHKVTSAAIYPAILLVVGMVVSLFLLGYVVPRFSAVYQGSGRSLPWASEVLMNWGQFAGQHTVEMLVGFGAGAATLVWWLRRLVAQGGWWRIIRLLPGAQPKLHILQLSRLYLTLGMLLEGGIPVQHALKLCTAVVDTAAREQLDAVRHDVESGQNLSESLLKHSLSTPVALRLLRVGEQSGQLGLMLSRTAAFYDEETTRWVERFSKAFEPVLMAAIGLVIGLIVILLYMPIFDLAGSLQ
ncbi:type II secretion system F family protein [Ramlibacter sp. WS9]|uniref:type II secretion system F family protein n=1 Tax=Ramlibacter sp. WS9 TaxID=1882741 RepID=UPI001142B5D8|nr:type II secretion system F family protein [Ramlibacter sp. WS9]ROZ79746.1 type II secretion system F family protein [Ramlibacter sp. WS9]